MEKNAEREPNAYLSQEASVIALVLKDSEQSQMDHAQMLMNVQKAYPLADMALNVSTQKVATLAFVHKAMVVIHTMDTALQLNADVPPTKNAEPMRNASNQVNVFAHHHSSLTPPTETNAKILVNDILAA